MPNKLAWIKIEEWEFQKILKEIAEGIKGGIHTLEKKM
jgi:hypothetical protein